MFMRTIERDIVGVFIMSADGKILLGYNRKGGVNQGQLVVPGGGVDDGEEFDAAARREMLEEVGIDLGNVPLVPADKPAYGESPKTLSSGEVVSVKMTFYNFRATLSAKAQDVQLRFDDDFEVAKWYSPQDLIGQNMGSATKAAVQEIWPQYSF